MRRAGAAWLVAGLLWFLLEAIAAHALPGYDYAHNYISDLGIPSPATFQGRPGSSPLALVMNADFIVHGTLFLTGAVLAFYAAGRGAARFVFLAFAIANAAGNVLVATIHNSAQAAADGSIVLHGWARRLQSTARTSRSSSPARAPAAWVRRSRIALRASRWGWWGS